MCVCVCVREREREREIEREKNVDLIHATPPSPLHGRIRYLIWFTSNECILRVAYMTSDRWGCLPPAMYICIQYKYEYNTSMTGPDKKAGRGQWVVYVPRLFGYGLPDVFVVISQKGIR